MTLYLTYLCRRGLLIRITSGMLLIYSLMLAIDLLYCYPRMVIDRSLADWDVAIECICAPLAEPIKGLRENIRYFW